MDTSANHIISHQTGGNNGIVRDHNSSNKSVLDLIVQNYKFVDVIFMDGKVMQGYVEDIDDEKTSISVLSMPGILIFELPLSSIKQISLKTAVQPEKHNLNDENNSQGFRIVFSDNEELPGNASNIHKDKDGLHIWKYSIENSIKHIFVPCHAIKHAVDNFRPVTF